MTRSETPDPAVTAAAEKALPNEPALADAPATRLDGSAADGWLYFGSEGLAFVTWSALLPGWPPERVSAESVSYEDLGPAHLTHKPLSRVSRISFASGAQFEGPKAEISDLERACAFTTTSD